MLFSGIFPAVLTLSLNFLVIKSAQTYMLAVITAFGFLILSTLGIANVRKITGNYTINVNKAFQNLLHLATLATAAYTFKNFIWIKICLAAVAAFSLILMIKPIYSLISESSGSDGNPLI